MRIGFENGKEVYLQIEGTGMYEVMYDDLVQQVVENTSTACSGEAYNKIASNVSFFSVISKEEYEIKHLGVEPTPIPDTSIPETSTTF